METKALLKDNLRCVIKKGDKVYTSEKRGIAPLMEAYDSGEDYSGGEAADRIVGKAAAFIYVKLKIKKLFAFVMSSEAIKVLDRYGVEYSFDKTTDFIGNRTGTGMCPMEATVVGIEEPDEAIVALKETLKRLQKAS